MKLTARTFCNVRMVLGVALFAMAVAGYGAAPQQPIVSKLAFTGDAESLDVRIDATGPARVEHFELENPPRLVLDFPNINTAIGLKEMAVGQAGVVRIRTSFFADQTRQATRIVFDLAGPAAYRIHDDGTGHVRVAFGKAAAPAPALAPVLVPVPAALEPPAPVTISELVPSLIETDLYASPLPAVIAQVAGLRDSLVAALSFRPIVPPALPPPVAPRTPAQAPQQQAPTQYTGEIVSLDLKDVDLKDFFRLISDISGLNVVLDPNISGTLTIMLKEVPWDQALDVVLKNYQLGSQLQGNVLRIASNTTLVAEESAKKAARDAVDAAVELDFKAYQLNYTKSDEMKTMLLKLLSARGEVVEDKRQNSVIVRDIPGNIARIDKMIQYADKAAPQVEIEARLLVANKSFMRDIGNQLGFLFGANSGNILTGGTGVPSPIPPGAASRAGGLPLFSNFPAAATSGLAFLMQPGSDILLDEIITLAESRGTAKTLSRPKIMTQNHKSATIQQGTQIPVQTSVNNTVSVQFITFALKLTVTPQIQLDANTILLDVQVENSQPDFARTVGSNGIPSVSTQQATTQVLVQDGGTATIGGILIDTDSVTVSSVPGLASIPVIGTLFKGTKTIKSTGELLFFVTAKVRPADTVAER